MIIDDLSTIPHFGFGLERTASTCIACGACAVSCPQHLPILDLMQQVAETFDAA